MRCAGLTCLTCGARGQPPPTPRLNQPELHKDKPSGQAAPAQANAVPAQQNPDGVDARTRHRYLPTRALCDARY
eukprot:2041986-Rhodomonas_salina.1